MRKRTMWLARNTGDSDIVLFAKRPKKVVSETEEYKCGCGSKDCVISYPAGKYVEFEGEGVDSFCSDGIRQAGVELKRGELVRVTLETVR